MFLVGTLLIIVALIVCIFEGDYASALIWLIASGIMVLIHIYFQKQKSKSNEFINWVAANIQNIKENNAYYNGIRIDEHTRITRFQICFSLVFITSKYSSKFFIEGEDNFVLRGLFYSLITFIFGWWGVPWGPIYTVQTIFRNIFGGYKKTVADLMAEIEQNNPTEEMMTDSVSDYSKA